MIRSTPRSHQHSQAGGITIIVSLMLLVLLTVAALAMSRNSLREIVTSGFSRQGAMARNVADSGIEWSIHWIDLENQKVATGAALQFARLQQGLLDQPTLAGVAKDLNSSDPSAPAKYVPGGTILADHQLPSPSGLVQGFTVGVTLMGSLEAPYTDQGTNQGDYRPAIGDTSKMPNLWSIRADAQVRQGAVTFIHAKETWISTPTRFSDAK